ncbi:MAG: hypothetical protein IJ662_08365 [Clostridia bacterium]|nr:hypothetical protein [Clostridia bacterium]
MRFDHYALYAEIVGQLRAWEREYPRLCRLSSIGKTYEGREIWLLTVTGDTGVTPEEKPALLLDGNLHSGEVASSMAVLYTLQGWLTAYGKDPGLTELLNRHTVYAIPRVNADAAEVYLTTPRTLRGSTEKYYPEDTGVVPADLDGDGEIRQMRILDPAGKWKAYEKDPRILMERGPEDVEGPFYTLVPEGELRGGPEAMINPRPAAPQEDLDPNRQFPFEWNKDYPDPARPTSGPEPLHDREVKALHGFVSSRPNIVFNMNFHTYGGLHISPAVFCPHLEVNPQDAQAMRQLGLSMLKKTGYKCEGIFPEGARDIAPGSYTTWEYFEKGIMAFVTELWDFHFQADPDRPENWSMFFAESEEQFLREAETALQWDERENAGRGFRPWTAFDHPQWNDPEAGVTVEIGGWAEKFCRQNPPPHLLEGVCQKAKETALVALKSLPRVQVLGLGRTWDEAQWKQDRIETILITLANIGYLPTSGTENAAQLGIGDDMTVTLAGCEVVDETPVRVERMPGFSKRQIAIRARIEQETDVTVIIQGSRCGKTTYTCHCLPRIDPAKEEKQ